MNKFIQIQPNELSWPFRNDMPTIYFKKKHTYSHSSKVDPFPCASHNMKLLKKCVFETASKFPLPCPVYWVTLPFEDEGRTNAFASSSDIYGDEHKAAAKKYLIEVQVVFSGKRTMIHPAMTKYLVAHEYGHIVDYYISAVGRKNGEKDHYWFRKEYAKMRGIKYSEAYGGGKWVNNTAEIIADDFRIAVAGVDVDFFVHNVTHPLKHPKVKAFWADMFKKYLSPPKRKSSIVNEQGR